MSFRLSTTRRLACLGALLALTIAAGARPPIEAICRAVDERYRTVFNLPCSWPNAAENQPDINEAPDNGYYPPERYTDVTDRVCQIMYDGTGALVGHFTSDESLEGKTTLPRPLSLTWSGAGIGSDVDGKLDYVMRTLCEMKTAVVPAEWIDSQDHYGASVYYYEDLGDVEDAVLEWWNDFGWESTSPSTLPPWSSYLVHPHPDLEPPPRYGGSFGCTSAKVQTNLTLSVEGQGTIYAKTEAGPTGLVTRPLVPVGEAYRRFAGMAGGSITTSDRFNHLDVPPSIPGTNGQWGWHVAAGPTALFKGTYKDEWKNMPGVKGCRWGCESCPDEHCVDPRVGSMSITIGLGRMAFADRHGSLVMKADVPRENLCTPGSLYPFLVEDDGYEMLPASGTPQQIKCLKKLVVIEAPTATRVVVKQYSLDGLGAKGGDGFYHPSGSPLVTTTIENELAGGAPNYNIVRMTNETAGPTRRCRFVWDEGTQTWTLYDGYDGSWVTHLRSEALSKTWDANHAYRTDDRTVKNGSGVIVSRVRQTYQWFPWADELVQEVVDPSGAALTTTYEYETDDLQPGYARLKSMQDPKGYWEKYNYDWLGRETKRVSPFGSSLITDPDDSNRVVETTYSSANPVETRVEKVLGQEVSRTYKENLTDEVREYRCTVAGVSFSDPNLLTKSERTITRTVSVFNDPVHAGMLESVTRPDGTLTTHAYSEQNGVRTTTVREGEANGAGTAVVSGRQTVTMTDLGGVELSRQVTDIATGLTAEHSTVTEFDALARPYKTEYLDGTYEITNQGCCGPQSRRDRFGVTTTYVHDSLGRTFQETRSGITTEYEHDAAGRVTKQTRIGTDSSRMTLSQTGYDVAGRRTWEKDALEHQTSYAEGFESGLPKTTTTYPNQATSTQIHYPDGTLYKVTGTGPQRPREYAYGVVSGGGGEHTTETRNNTTTEWVRTERDMLGRVVRVVYPGASVQATSHYNTLGQLVKSEDPDQVTTLYAYNARGEREVTALDMDRDGVIDYAGTDRITTTVASVVSESGVVKERRTTSEWQTAGADTPVVVAVSDRFVASMESDDTRNDLTTHNKTELEANEGRKETVTSPDGAKLIRRYSGDRLTQEQRLDSDGAQIALRTRAFDEHGRMESETDARNGTTLYTHYGDDRVHTVTTPAVPGFAQGLTTSYVYTAMGETQEVHHPDGSSVTSYEYWPTGDLKTVGGAGEYPQSMTYDSEGRRLSLTVGSGTTAWEYSSTRGWLTKKTYQGGKHVDYDYTAAGRLHTRTWARGVVTTYGHNNAGELTTTDYSDSTPDVTVAYTRRGLVDTVSDVCGTRQLDQYTASGMAGRERFTAGTYTGALTLTRSEDGFARRAALSVASAAGAVQSVAYGYDKASRLASLEDDADNKVEFVRSANSDLVSDAVYSVGGSEVARQVTVHDNLNRVEDTRGKRGTTPIGSPYLYTYDSLGRRTRVEVASGEYWEYGYNARNEVVSGQKKLSSGTGISGTAFGYGFDAAGNRTGGFRNGINIAYTPNALNQYVSRTVPGVADVWGEAAAGATVTVNGTTATRQSNYFYRAVSVDNSAAPKYPDITVRATTTQGAVSETGGHAFVPKTPEAFVHDTDGNLTSDGRWTYSWDGENRLTTMTALASVPALAQRQIVCYYDYMSRRVRKLEFTRDPSTGQLTVPAGNAFYAWDGWTLAAELAGDGSPVRRYLWNTARGHKSLAAVRLGAGTGAASPPAQFAIVDGNDNVMRLVNGATPAGATAAEVTAVYEYGPFGEPLRATGPAADANLVRFSSETVDTASGFYYYGYRYYSPDTGRWISRDPIGERGGVNLYCMCKNLPVLRWDYLGTNTCCDLRYPPLYKLRPPWWELVVVPYALSGKASDKPVDLDKMWSLVTALEWAEKVHSAAGAAAGGVAGFAEGIGTATEWSIDQANGAAQGNSLEWAKDKIKKAAFEWQSKGGLWIYAKIPCQACRKNARIPEPGPLASWCDGVHWKKCERRIDWPGAFSKAYAGDAVGYLADPGDPWRGFKEMVEDGLHCVAIAQSQALAGQCDTK
jgi:RHS repeat-associated protein